MPASTTSTPEFRVRIRTTDGTHEVLDKNVPNGSPRPLDDDELEAVAGGADYEFVFECGYEVGLTDYPGTWGEALQDALAMHSTFCSRC